MEQQVTTAYASRGYPLPPGALLAKLDDIQLGQLAANGEQATQIAAEQYKAEIEMIKFAVEEALKLRMQAMNAALDYIRAIASMPDTALKTYNMKDENWARMLQAAATWYNAFEPGRDYSEEQDNGKRAGLQNLRAQTDAGHAQ